MIGLGQGPSLALTTSLKVLWNFHSTQLSQELDLMIELYAYNKKGALALPDA